MLQSSLYRIVRIVLVFLDFWFNTDLPESHVQRSGKTSQSMPSNNLNSSSSAQQAEMTSPGLEMKTWEEIYQDECLSFKACLETQARILRNDPESQGVDRINDVRIKLISLSHQAERIKEAAFEMVDETPDSVYVRNATPEWLSTRFGDPQLEQVCISMEYSLDRLAFELRSDPSMDLMVAGHLEQMTDDIEMDFLYRRMELFILLSIDMWRYIFQCSRVEMRVATDFVNHCITVQVLYLSFKESEGCQKLLQFCYKILPNFPVTFKVLTQFISQNYH